MQVAAGPQSSDLLGKGTQPSALSEDSIYWEKEHNLLPSLRTAVFWSTGKRNTTFCPLWGLQFSDLLGKGTQPSALSEDCSFLIYWEKEHNLLPSLRTAVFWLHNLLPSLRTAVFWSTGKRNTTFCPLWGLQFSDLLGKGTQLPSLRTAVFWSTGKRNTTFCPLWGLQFSDLLGKGTQPSALSEDCSFLIYWEKEHNLLPSLRTAVFWSTGKRNTTFCPLWGLQFSDLLGKGTQPSALSEDCSFLIYWEKEHNLLDCSFLSGRTAVFWSTGLKRTTIFCPKGQFSALCPLWGLQFSDLLGKGTQPSALSEDCSFLIYWEKEHNLLPTEDCSFLIY